MSISIKATISLSYAHLCLSICIASTLQRAESSSLHHHFPRAWHRLVACMDKGQTSTECQWYSVPNARLWGGHPDVAQPQPRPQGSKTVQIKSQARGGREPTERQRRNERFDSLGERGRKGLACHGVIGVKHWKIRRSFTVRWRGRRTFIRRRNCTAETWHLKPLVPASLPGRCLHWNHFFT